MLTDVTHNSEKEADVARVMQNKNKKINWWTQTEKLTNTIHCRVMSIFMDM